MHFVGRFSKIHKTFLYKLFSSEGHTKRRTDVMNRISKFRYVITNALPTYTWPAKFLAFLPRVEPIDITVCQVKKATYAVKLLTKIIWIQEVPISYSKPKINHYISRCEIVCLQFLLRHYNCLSYNSIYLQATDSREIWWVKCA